MDHNDILLRFVYLPLAALTGAISSLGARRWRTMGRGQIMFVILTGVSFALFVTPYVAQAWIGISVEDARAMVAMTYLFGFGAHLFLPWAVRHVMKLTGTENAE